jgi:hypothetical protein
MCYKSSDHHKEEKTRAEQEKRHTNVKETHEEKRRDLKEKTRVNTRQENS